MRKEKYRITYGALAEIIKRACVLPEEAEIVYVGVDYEREIVSITVKNVGEECSEGADVHTKALKLRQIL